MNGTNICAEVNIVGDCVSGIFNTSLKQEINEVLNTAARISSLIDVMNYKFEKNNIEQIKVGIGLSYGRALMIKAGYNGSSINDLVWMGEVVNEASELASYGNQTYSDTETMVSNNFYENLNEHNQELLVWNYSRNCYNGNIIWIEMNEWYQENCK